MTLITDRLFMARFNLFNLSIGSQYILLNSITRVVGGFAKAASFRGTSFQRLPVINTNQIKRITRRCPIRSRPLNEPTGCSDVR